MSDGLRHFLDAALKAGVAERLAAMLDDVDRAIADAPRLTNARHLRRLEAQRDRLRRPDLDLIVRLTGAVYAAKPSARVSLDAAASALPVTYDRMRADLDRARTLFATD